MQLSIITAIGKNQVIGIRNHLPWSLPADLLRFKRITWGKAIIMGRHTYESIGHALPGRKNIVLSSHSYVNYQDCFVYASLDEALNRHHDEKEIFIIGGGNLYQQTIAKVDRLYLTIIHHEFEGDTFFPPWDCKEWEIMEQEECIADAHNRYSYTFQTLKRIASL